MNRNNGAQSSCVLLTMIISGCQHCWLWGVKDFPCASTDLTPISKLSKSKQTTGCFALQGGLPISFLWKVFTDFYKLVCSIFPEILLACTCTKAGLCLHRGHLEAILVEGDLCSAHRGAKHSCWAGHFHSRRKLLIMDCHCPPHRHIPLGKPSLFFPAHSVSCSLNFCVWKKAQISTEISLHIGSLCSAPCLGGAICGVCGFKPTTQPGFKCKPFNRVQLTVPKTYEFCLTCCQYFELSVAQSSRLFPRINRALWHTELSHLAGIQRVSPYE